MAKDLVLHPPSRRRLVAVEVASIALLALGIACCIVEAIVIVVHLIAFWVTTASDNSARPWCQEYCPPFNQHGFWHMMGAYPLLYLFVVGGVALIAGGNRSERYHDTLEAAAQVAEVRRKETAHAEELAQLRSEAFPVDRLTLVPRLFNVGVSFTVIVEVRTQIGEDPRTLTFPLHRVSYVAAPMGPASTDAFFPERTTGGFGPQITVMTNRPPFWLRVRGDNLFCGHSSPGSLHVEGEPGRVFV